MPYRIRKIRGRYYLYKEWYDRERRAKVSRSLGPLDEIERLVLEARARAGKRRTQGLAGPRGFEPRTTGSAGRRPILARRRALRV